MLGAAEWDTLDVAPLIPLLPLLAAVLVGMFGTRILRSASHWPVIFGVGGALVCSIILLSAEAGRQAGPPADGSTASAAHAYPFYSWISLSSDAAVEISFWTDPLTAVMLTMVCTVSLLVVIYSRDYMRDHGRPERGYERFFAFLGLFVFSMCTLVLAGNFLLLYLGWEAVGLCSYLLIGFHYDRPAAAAAAKKAFLVNRIGDFGFALGILCIYLWITPYARPGQNPLDYTVVFDSIGHLAEHEPWKCTTIALLLFCGAVGKSAQLPLYVWLPDAMEGPSPVSALIHAATMVTAGVYMVVRCGPIFAQSAIAMAVVASVGAVTALYAATIALAQYDMKRILAYSTISQLGYMFLGAGVFAADSAIFHLFTHAFFKALLFLAAGSVMHAMGGVIDLRRFSGLRRVLPVTCTTFVIGALALAGCPLLSGFFSKDEIIHAAFAQLPLLGIIALLTALLTAFYTFRMVFLAFWGTERLPPGAHPRESGRWMLLPMILLAVGAIAAGYVGVTIKTGGFAGFAEPHGTFHDFLKPVVAPFAEAQANPRAASHLIAASHQPDHTLMYVSAALAVLGIALAYVLYAWRRSLADAIPRAAPQAYDLLHHKYYIDEMNDTLVVQPLWQTARLLGLVDRLIVDGLVWIVSVVPRALGWLLRGLQNGAMQGYGVTMTGGLVLIVFIVWLMR